MVGAIFIPGCDFTLPETQAKILSLLHVPDTDTLDMTTPLVKTEKPQLVDIVLSDMAPNSSGMAVVDHPRIISLARKALTFALNNGKTGSHFLTKIWDGNESNSFERELETLYSKVSRLKPPSSRGESSEVFLFAKSKKA